MLTKDLVRFKRAKNKIHPRFIDPKKTELLEMAASMLVIFNAAPGQTRGELKEAVAEVIGALSGNDLVARGLEKLLLDRTEFEEPVDEQMVTWRHALFLNVNQWMASRSTGDYPEFENGIAALIDTSFEEAKAKLYSDLPEFLPATRFRKLEPLQLLYRYNSALVQWLLLQAENLKIVLAHQEPSHLRQLCKYLRFHQLLARVKQVPGGSYHILIDGPMSLFHQSKKYGMSLARFFPALLHQPVWRLEAEIRIGKHQKFQLDLDHQTKLKPFSHQFHAYIPREILRFETAFKEKISDWTLEPGSRFIPLAGEQLCFPDYHLAHKTGMHIDVEFFHAWHARPLKARLGQIEGLKSPLLLLGVSRKLAKDPTIAELLDASEYFKEYGLLFSEIPAVRPLSQILQKLAD